MSGIQETLVSSACVIGYLGWEAFPSLLPELLVCVIDRPAIEFRPMLFPGYAKKK